MSGNRKEFSINLGNMSGGVNTVDPPVSLAQNCVSQAINALFLKQGFLKAPGFKGLKSGSAIFGASCTGLGNYQQYDGTEKTLAVSGAHLYGVTNAGVETQIDGGLLSGTGEVWGTSFLNKWWMVNGTKVLKVESDYTTHQVGITPPSGVTAVAATVGAATLPAGLYQIYVSYCRKVSGVNRLYSKGQLVASVTVTGPNNAITFTFADSADAQVNNKVVWMTDAGGSALHFFWETGDNTTTSFSITDVTTYRNTSLIYDFVAAGNSLPPALQWLIAADNRLVGAIDNVIYYSKKGTTVSGAPVYDIECWPSENIYQLPFKTTMGFTLGRDLFINTPGGIFVIPSCDFSGKFYHIESNLYFIEPRTIQVRNSVAWGLTNDGFRFFDGENWSIDLSRNIKPDIDRIYAGITAGFKPCGIIYRRSGIRTEYQLSYRDLSVSASINNRTLVLDLDAVVVENAKNFNAPWDIWETGFNYAFSNSSNKIYKAQSKTTESTIYSETACGDGDVDIFNKSGAFLTALTKKQTVVKSRHVLLSSDAIVEMTPMWVLAKINSPMIVSIFIEDSATSYYSQQVTIEQINPIILDEAILDDVPDSTMVFATENPYPHKIKMPQSISGKVFSVQITSNENDSSFQVLDILIKGMIETGRIT